MSVQAISWAYAQRDLPHPAKFVLVTLANYANASGKDCFPGQQTLAEDTGMDKRTVMRCMKLLEEVGLISRAMRRRTNGTRSSDDITLHLKRTVWPVGHLTIYDS